MTPVSTVEFHLSEREFAGALRHLARRHRSFRLLAVLTPVILVLGLITGQVLAILSGVVVVLSLVLLLFVSPRQQWRRNPRRDDGQQYTFDESAVLIVTPSSRAEVAWSYYVDVVESSDSYLLLTVNNICTVVPRRTFASTDDEARFRDLVARRREAGTLKSAGAAG